MTSPHLPRAITEHLATRLEQTGRSALKSAQAKMSDIYRAGGHSRIAVPDATAALAYAVARMPATYAACARAFGLAAGRVPDFAPRTVLDLGAGPGTATFAAAAAWSGLASAHLLEPNAAMAALAADLLGATTSLTCTHAAGDVADSMAGSADLVVVSYVLAEQPEADVANLVGRAATRALGMIAIVEPGTPAGYARILAARGALVDAGFTLIAPCPHGNPCPLPAGDWCHFSVRLQRTAAHMHLKDASVPFEDEPFCFVAATRNASADMPPAARLIRPARVEKGFVDLALCTPDGLESRRVKRRDAAAYKAAKALDWGDAVTIAATT